MAKKIREIDYDYSNDILFISRNDKVKTSLDIGDFVLDVNHNNFICGIEIIDASENLGISKKALKKIKNLRMSVKYRTNHVYVLLTIIFEEKSKEANITIPLTLGLDHKTPKKDALVFN